MTKGRVVVVRCAGTDETGLNEQYLHSRCAASLASSTVLVLRASTTLLHVGGGEYAFSHFMSVALRESEVLRCSVSIEFSVPTLSPSPKPMLYHFALTSANSSITFSRPFSLSC